MSLPFRHSSGRRRCPGVQGSGQASIQTTQDHRHTGTGVRQCERLSVHRRCDSSAEDQEAHARLLLKNEGFPSEAMYDTMPLEQQMGVISSLGRRYLECLQLLDQVMPMLRTLERFSR
jgi:hypothetical protein